MNMDVKYVRTARGAKEAIELITRLELALRKIKAIPNAMEGSDWDEIEEAREIAENALATTSGEGVKP
jgi:hypothetical protein